MIINILKKTWFHILVWIAIFSYFIFAPDLVASFLVEDGKPIKMNDNAFSDSDRITFSVDGFEPFIQDGESLYRLFGWALIVPDESTLNISFSKEIVLVSDERTYSFSVTPVYRNPHLPDRLANMEFDLDTLGFSASITEYAIKPGTYRIGVVFRNASLGLAYYSDKPSRYLIRTPNTIKLQK